MVKAVIYDFDGTLADTFSLHLEAYSFALGKFNIQATDDEVIRNCFNKLDDQAAKNFKINNLALFSKYYRQGILEATRKTKLYPNVVTTLETLKKNGLQLGIATARKKKEMIEIFKVLKIEKYFDILMTHDDVKNKKPDPEIFLAVCDKLEVGNHEVIIVGDSDVDIIAANKMNAKSVLFYPKSHEKIYKLDDLKKLKPYRIIKNNSDIIELLKKLKANY
jgi:HAD superfamily hydrolase (TIGR01509 family)